MTEENNINKEELNTEAKSSETETPVVPANEASPVVENKEVKAEEVKAVNPETPRAPSANADKNKEARGGGGSRGGGNAGGGGGRGGSRGGGGGGGDRRNNNNSRRKRTETEEPSEYIEKVVQVRRVTKVVKGGKKLSFRTTVIIGNEKGKVGVGVGKASEVLIAIKKAISDARKNLVDIETVANTNTISHTVIGRASGARVLLKPAAEGTGIIAGGTARIVLELAGVGDILSKSLASKSPLNVARATVNALSSLRKFQEVAASRGTSVKKMLFA